MRNAFMLTTVTTVTAGVLAGIAAVNVSAQDPAPQVQVVAREADRRVDITIGGKPFTSYLWPTTI
jgi:hypothetical protein